MKKISLIIIIIVGFLVGWFLLPMAMKLFDLFTTIGFKFVCCNNTTKIARASLIFSYLLILVTCLFLSLRAIKNYSIGFAIFIAIGTIASIFMSLYWYETPFTLWLKSPFIEATITAICIPASVAWIKSKA